MSGSSRDGRARPPLGLGAAVPAATADGTLAAAHYGGSAAEYERLRGSCGLVDRLWVEHLELRGEDRARFLNGLVTGDVKRLVSGDGLFAFFTSAQGRILSEVRVAAGAESLLLELPAGRAAPIAEHLGQYIVADRVEVTPRPELRALTLLGPDAFQVAARFGTEPGSDRWSHRRGEWNGCELVLAREERLGEAAVTVRVADDAAADLARELTSGEEAAAAAVGFEAVEALRVEAGLARFGPDFGSERFPQEVGAEEALDFEKGCYLGQEVVARIHYRGKVNHRLCGLRLEGDELPAPGSAVALDGDEVGRSGTAVRSPRLGQGITLAILHRRAEPGALVSVDGVDAVAVDLPFMTD